MRLNGKPTTRLIVQYSRRRSYPTTPAVPRGGCMGCFHLPWPVFSDGSIQPCTGTSKGNHGDHVHGAPTAGWTVDVDCYHDSRATLKLSPEVYTAYTYTAVPSQWLIQSDCTFRLYWVFVTSYRILLISLSLHILETFKMTIIRFNVFQCEHCTLSLINTFAAESWIAE